jgi:hypothetical protein
MKGVVIVTHTRRKRLPATGTEPLLAGFDTITYSSRARISQEVRAQLAKDNEAAQLAAKVRAVHCPEWLGARVLPNGDAAPSVRLATMSQIPKVSKGSCGEWGAD